MIVTAGSNSCNVVHVNDAVASIVLILLELRTLCIHNAPSVKKEFYCTDTRLVDSALVTTNRDRCCFKRSEHI